MDRFILPSLGLLLFAAAGVSAQPGPPPDGPGKRDDCGDPRVERFKKKLEKMAPEERERFRQNWERWKKMGDREREEFRKKAEAERQRMRKTIDDAIAKAGLTLSADEREVFVLRYRQERRKIEEELRQETESLRAAKIDAALERLKAEFKPSSPSPSPAPAPSASPTAP